MINLDSFTNKNIREHNKNGTFQIICTRILIIGGSASGKTNELLHLIKKQGDIDKTYLYAKDLSKP